MISINEANTAMAKDSFAENLHLFSINFNKLRKIGTDDRLGFIAAWREGNETFDDSAQSSLSSFKECRSFIRLIGSNLICQNHHFSFQDEIIFDRDIVEEILKIIHENNKEDVTTALEKIACASDLPHKNTFGAAKILFCLNTARMFMQDDPINNSVYSATAEQAKNLLIAGNSLANCG